MTAGIERILDLTEAGAYLRVENRRLVIERRDQPTYTAPLDEIAVVIAAQSRMTLTQPALAGLAECGGVLVVCDARCMPVALSLPLFGHSLQAQTLRRQIAATEPTVKRLWQRIVKAKIAHQSAALRALGRDDGGIGTWVRRVRSGDPDNVEAQAARAYWPLLTRSALFRREREGEPPNDLLNYGYGVLRAVIARAVCATGLSPALGLHHRNRDNSFCLVDDLMEPFRPLVDFAVGRLVDQSLTPPPLDRSTKAVLLAPILGRVCVVGESRTVFDAATRMTASLLRAFDGDPNELLLPELSFGLPDP